MRLALVSPYSYTYPGGVVRHVEALAQQFIAQGHDVRLMAPYDPDDRLARLTHRGARPEAREAPDYFISLGRSVGIPANGAVSNVSITPYTVAVLDRELRHGGYDVVHVHEPNGAVPAVFTTETARVLCQPWSDGFSGRPCDMAGRQAPPSMYQAPTASAPKTSSALVRRQL